MMPLTRSIRFAPSDCFRGSMIGIPPPTAASISTYTPAALAAAAISVPWRAITALLAVTTDFPAAMAWRMRLRAGSMPPITSTNTSTAGSFTTAAGSVVNIASGSSTGLGRLRSRTATFTSSRSFTRGCRSWGFSRIEATPPPTVPKPNRPTPILVPIPCVLCWNV